MNKLNKFNKILLSLIIAILMFLMIGNAIEKLTDTSSIKIENNSNLDSETAIKTNFFALMYINKNNIKAREKLVWDGERLQEVEVDDHIFNYKTKDILTNTKETKAFEFEYPLLDTMVIDDDEINNACKIYNDTLNIQIRRIDYTLTKKQLSEDNNFKQSEIIELDENTKNNISEYNIYIGFYEQNNEQDKIYVGYTLILRSLIDTNSYMVQVTGIGNLVDIENYANMVFNSFKVLK